MSEEERSEEEQAPRRPRVVDKRISARAASGETATPAAPADPPPADPPPPVSPEPQQQATPQAPEASEPPPPGQEVWTPEQEAEARRMAEEIAKTPSLDWVVQTAVTLANVAGTKMQLGAAADAQLAIDALAGIVDTVGPRLEDAEAPLRQTLAQLQMMYAERAAPPPRG